MRDLDTALFLQFFDLHDAHYFVALVEIQGLVLHSKVRSAYTKVLSFSRSWIISCKVFLSQCRAWFSSSGSSLFLSKSVIRPSIISTSGHSYAITLWKCLAPSTTTSSNMSLWSVPLHFLSTFSGIWKFLHRRVALSSMRGALSSSSLFFSLNLDVSHFLKY